MSHSYSSYKNDIILFNSEEYLKNLENSVSHDYFLSFIENYKEIENEDFKKPIFSQTTKFKKIPNTTNKNYKYLKINRDNDDSKNVWVFEDDCVFAENFIERAKKCIEDLRSVEWDMFYCMLQ